MMPKLISFYRLVLIFLITRKEQPEIEEVTKTIIIIFLMESSQSELIHEVTQRFRSMEC